MCFEPGFLEEGFSNLGDNSFSPLSFLSRATRFSRMEVSLVEQTGDGLDEEDGAVSLGVVLLLVDPADEYLVGELRSLPLSSSACSLEHLSSLSSVYSLGGSTRNSMSAGG